MLDDRPQLLSLFEGIGSAVILGSFALDLYFSIVIVTNTRLFGPLAFFYAFTLFMRRVRIPVLLVSLLFRDPKQVRTATS